MRIRLGFFLAMLLSTAGIMPVWAATDEFDFSNFAITESGDADLNASSVSLNPGAEPITVNNFDIAGLMLGMSFEDVETLFFNA